MRSLSNLTAPGEARWLVSESIFVRELHRKLYSVTHLSL